MHFSRETRFPLWTRWVMALALVVSVLCEPAPLMAALEVLSSGAALLATLSGEAQVESYLELLLETCQAQLKRLQWGWQRLTLGNRMALLWVIRVMGPPFLMLLFLFCKALRRGLRQQCEWSEAQLC